MKTGSIIVILLVLLMAVMPVISSAQYASGTSSQQDTYNVNLDEILDNYGLGDSDRIVKINVEPAIMMHSPLVIMGSGADVLERQGFDIYTDSNPIDPAQVLDDSDRFYQGQSIENYDLILIGGPDQNAYAKDLLDRKMISYGVTDLKMPGIVIEEAHTSGGHTILVIGDVDSYPYHKKDLPLNGILPEKYAATAAVVFGFALGMLGAFSLVGNFLTSWWDRIWKLVKDYLFAHAGEVASEKDAEIRKIEASKTKKALFLGYSAKEVLAAAVCAVIFGVAFVIADRLALLPDNIWLYIVTGGLVVVAHDLAHRLVAHRSKVNSEFQLWGLGTVILLLTAWLFGLAFAQPGRFLIEKEGTTPRKLAMITLAGPVISLVLSILFLPLVFFGGVIAQVGLLGFTMNLVTVVYNLMPFGPMDGKVIFDWSRLFWLLLFAPVFVFFVIMTYFVLG